ncbi:MAG: MiaB/RimO family radical SAM methylthiotransferase, partial [Micromonosporaceae bacterium]|nr:MiaB/RimO family radical SAM methylthiotransferase [Micromonosporaceae bacterium]
MSLPGSSASSSNESSSNGQAGGRQVAVVTLGCARNEADSEELAARLTLGGWRVTTDCSGADVVLVNTCGFIDKAKRDSIEMLLSAAETGVTVVATGCLAERFGSDLAGSLPEVAAVLGFDHYADISDRVATLMAGEAIPSHAPRDRRDLAPRRVTGGVVRQRLDQRPVAPLKLATGCDRRCAFCAIPAIRGRFVSRQPDEVLAEAEWLAAAGVRELLLVSENSTSYGKDLGDLRMLEKLLGELAAISGIVRVRVSYLQPAELRSGLIEAIATTPGVAPYFDLSFQHASESVLRRMRRFGSTGQFLELIETIRRFDQQAGIRSNVIVGFPGESRADVAELERFLAESGLDAIGVFDYSDEEGTEAATLSHKITPVTIGRRYAKISGLVERLCAQRAAGRIGSVVEILIDGLDEDGNLEG